MKAPLAQDKGGRHDLAAIFSTVQNVFCFAANQRIFLE
jgi:hypothetical protein